MDERVRAAAANNAAWCDLVCRSHGIGTVATSRLWFALSRPPRFYPDLVTLDPGIGASDVIRSVGDREACAVKDSFGVLELTEHGFEELFRASWVYAEPAPPLARSRLAWSVVDTPEALSEWSRAAGQPGTFVDELLGEPSTRFLVVHGAEGIALARSPAERARSLASAMSSRRGCPPRRCGPSSRSPSPHSSRRFRWSATSTLRAWARPLRAGSSS